MTQSPTGSVYDRTYQDYLERLKEAPYRNREAVLGITRQGETVRVPYFGQFLSLTPDGLVDEAGQQPDFADCVVVCRYLIMAPPFEPSQTAWVAYRDFPDAGPLTVFWSDSVERPLALAFAGRVDELLNATAALGGRTPAMEIGCDLCRCFTPLPKVPLLLVFNDADDDFPAAASLLFEKRASTYLDAESQAILGHALTRRLLASAGR